MSENSSKSQETTQEKPEPVPNEHGGFYFSSFVKIFDPNTKQVLVQKRGDN